MLKIQNVRARQILDSRGEPTLEAEVTLEGGATGTGSAPSGASTGSYEAPEKRDGGKIWFGRGVLNAVDDVNGPIREALLGLNAAHQRDIDARMLEAGAFGANSTIAVSWAVAEAAARARGMELYEHLGGVQALELPTPMFNVVNGGRHAANNLEIQEFMFVPAGAISFHEALRMGAVCCRALGELLHADGLSITLGDEGGFAPNLDSDAQALEYMLRAIEAAGWRPGEDMCMALDVAASGWAEDGAYVQAKSGRCFRRDELIDYLDGLAERFPLLSIEDPLGEDDFEGFAEITRAFGNELMIVGDDLFVTNPNRLAHGAEMGAANAIIVKPNQIGTLSETLTLTRLAQQNGYRLVVSHRSGETNSTAIADLAVAVGAQYIKAGAPVRGERVAKYNRLLQIEESLDG